MNQLKETKRPVDVRTPPRRTARGCSHKRDTGALARGEPRSEAGSKAAAGGGAAQQAGGQHSDFFVDT